MSLSKNRLLFFETESSAICVGYKRERTLAALMRALIRPKVGARFGKQGIA